MLHDIYLYYFLPHMRGKTKKKLNPLNVYLVLFRRLMLPGIVCINAIIIIV